MRGEMQPIASVAAASPDRRRTLCCLGGGGHGRTVAAHWHRQRGGEVVFADQRLNPGARVGPFVVAHSSLDTVAGQLLLVTLVDNGLREAVHLRALRLGIELAFLVASPETYFAPDPGAGSVVLAGAVVNPGAHLGQGVIVNSGAVIEHDCMVDDFAHISPNATLAEGVSIGVGVWIGAGATVLPGVTIAAGSVIGAGAVVTRNILQPGTWAGVPARQIG